MNKTASDFTNYIHSLKDSKEILDEISSAIMSVFKDSDETQALMLRFHSMPGETIEELGGRFRKPISKAGENVLYSYLALLPRIGLSAKTRSSIEKFLSIREKQTAEKPTGPGYIKGRLPKKTLPKVTIEPFANDPESRMIRLLDKGKFPDKNETIATRKYRTLFRLASIYYDCLD